MNILIIIIIQAATVVTRAPTARCLRNTEHQNYEHLSHNHDAGCHSSHQGSHRQGPEVTQNMRTMNILVIIMMQAATVTFGLLLRGAIGTAENLYEYLAHGHNAVVTKVLSFRKFSKPCNFDQILVKWRIYTIVCFTSL